MGSWFWISIFLMAYGVVLLVFPKQFARWGRKLEQMQGDHWAASILTPGFIRVIGCLFIVGPGLTLIELLLHRGP
ncbi:hypothetical protein ACQXVK_13580 [Curtobacterium sp. AB451]|uniref:hypothetical protein n=1 Tax=unclassified Curtobacterium TaxID=257496 RepID=UPI000347673B|nr:hypothetical protein [Curtobacterium sp. B18]